MKQLIIHMDDRTTDFLCEIYEDVPNITVVRKPLPAHTLNEMIMFHDRVIMLGHGSPQGLFSTTGGYIIDKDNAEALRGKDNIYIWCHANIFVEQNGLTGFSTGMFISEVMEAKWHNVRLKAKPQSEINESNRAFAQLVRSQIEKPVEAIYECCYNNYTSDKMDDSDVVKFNHYRLQLFTEDHTIVEDLRCQAVSLVKQVKQWTEDDLDTAEMNDIVELDADILRERLKVLEELLSKTRELELNHEYD